jgi:hypothetical protein
METTGATPPGAVTASDLAELSKVGGPFVTVYLTTEQDVPNAGQLAEQRWKSLRSELGDQGAPADLLADIDPLVEGAHEHGACLAVVANAHGVIHVEHGPAEPDRDLGVWGPLPALTQIIEWRQATPTYVAVLVDRKGADISAFRYGLPETSSVVEGDDDPITKSGPGGWSQQRYQRRAENTWEQNAAEVAEELTDLVKKYDPRVVVAAGDVRALGFLAEHLSHEVQEIYRTVEGGARSEASSEEALLEHVREVVDHLVAEDGAALLEAFGAEAGRHHLAASGPEQTAGALAMAQVDVLLVHNDPSDERTAWFGPDPSQVALTAEVLKDFGVTEPLEARLADVFVRAALGTGAGIRVIPGEGGSKEGVGALLRWATPEPSESNPA